MLGESDLHTSATFRPMKKQVLESVFDDPTGNSGRSTTWQSPAGAYDYERASYRSTPGFGRVLAHARACSPGYGRYTDSAVSPCLRYSPDPKAPVAVNFKTGVLESSDEATFFGMAYPHETVPTSPVRKLLNSARGSGKEIEDGDGHAGNKCHNPVVAKVSDTDQTRTYGYTRRADWRRMRKPAPNEGFIEEIKACLDVDHLSQDVNLRYPLNEKQQLSLDHFMGQRKRGMPKDIDAIYGKAPNTKRHDEVCYDHAGDYAKIVPTTNPTYFSSMRHGAFAWTDEDEEGSSSLLEEILKPWSGRRPQSGPVFRSQIDDIFDEDSIPLTNQHVRSHKGTRPGEKLLAKAQSIYRTRRDVDRETSEEVLRAATKRSGKDPVGKLLKARDQSSMNVFSCLWDGESAHPDPCLVSCEA